MFDLRTFVIQLSIMLALGLLLALLGPFGTFSIGGFPERLAYWVSLAVGGYLIYRPAMALATRAAARLDLPEVPAWIVATIAATVPMTFLVWVVSFRHTPTRWPSVAAYFDLYWSVLVIGAVISLIFWFRRGRDAAGGPPFVAATASAPAPPAAAPPAAAPPVPAPLAAAVPGERFLERIPPTLGRELLALKMEDHYLRVHGAAGSTLILLRLRDAIAELGGVDGRQVHRSWWVARAAVARAIVDGRNVRLRLTNGLEVPVACNSVAQLRDAGWF